MRFSLTKFPQKLDFLIAGLNPRSQKRDLGQPIVVSAYVNDWTLGRIFDSAAEDFVGQGSSIALAKKDVTHPINDWIDIGPVKVDMGNAFCALLEVDEQRSDGICDRGAPGMEDLIRSISKPVDLQKFGEVRGVSPFHLHKVDEG